MAVCDSEFIKYAVKVFPDNGNRFILTREGGLVGVDKGLLVFGDVEDFLLRAVYIFREPPGYSVITEAHMVPSVFL